MNKEWLEVRYNEVFSAGLEFRIGCRTAMIDALCRMFEIQTIELDKRADLIKAKFKEYSLLKAKATKEFIINGNTEKYNIQMKSIDFSNGLTDVEWFIYKKMKIGE